MRKVSRLVAAGVVGTTLFLAAPVVTGTAGAQVVEPCIITGASGPISGPLYKLGRTMGILKGPVQGLGCAFDTLGL